MMAWFSPKVWPLAKISGVFDWGFVFTFYGFSVIFSVSEQRTICVLIYKRSNRFFRHITGNGCFWNGCYGAGTGGRGLDRGQWNSSGHAISVDVMPQWAIEHRVFEYDSFVKRGETIIETQRLFRCRFNIGRHGNIPSRNTILRWVTSFRARGTIMKKKPPGPVATARTPENVERERPSWGVQPVLLGDMLSNWEWAKAR